MLNYIREYTEKIKSGEIIASSRVIALYEIICDGLDNGEWFYNDRKAYKAIAFIENFCHHNEGSTDLLKLELWQKALISVMFGILDENGLRQFREIFLVIARKNGKSLLASAIACELMFADGEAGAKCYMIAPKLDQADICYNNFWQMTQNDEELKDLIVHRQQDLYIKSTEGHIKKVAFTSKKSDGYNPQISLLDEVAAWQGDAGLKQYNVMKSAMGARKQPMLMAFTTANYIDGGIYDDLIARADKFLKRESTERRFLPVLYIIDDAKKWDDINELKKSNPNMGVSVTEEYLLEEIETTRTSPAKRSEFLCKYCNLKQTMACAWLSPNDVKNNVGDASSINTIRDRYCVVGVDLSRTTDLTCALAVVNADGKDIVYSHFWLPREKKEVAIARDNLPYDIYEQRGFITFTEGANVDYMDVVKWIEGLTEELGITPLVVGYDRYSANYFINELKNIGLMTDDCWQGFNLTPAINEVEEKIYNGQFDFMDNQLMIIHLLNAGVAIDTESNRRKLIKIDKKTHIDGVAALLDALIVRQKYHEDFKDYLFR